MNYQKEKKGDFLTKVFLFLTMPFVSFFYALLRLKTKSSIVIIFFVCILFGISFTVPQIRTDANNLDGIAYRTEFEFYTQVTEEMFSDEFNEYLSFSGNYPDFFDKIVYFFVSRFSDNYHIMFLVISLIFAIPMIKCLKIFVLDKKFNYSLASFILLYFFMANQIFNINAFRFFIGLWFSVLSILNIFLYKKNAYWAVLVFVPFIHASFFINYLLVIVYFVTKKKYKLLFALFVSSFLVSTFAASFFKIILENMPAFLMNKYQYYIGENYINYINSGGSGFIWVKRLFETITIVYINILTIIMFKNRRKNITLPEHEALFNFLLVTLIFVNFTLFVPSVGSRFILLTCSLLAYLWLTCFSSKKYNIYIYMLGGLLAIEWIFPFKIFQFPCIRYYLSVLNPIDFISPSLSLILNHLNI